MFGGKVRSTVFSPFFLDSWNSPTIPLIYNLSGLGVEYPNFSGVNINLACASMGQ